MIGITTLLITAAAAFGLFVMVGLALGHRRDRIAADHYCGCRQVIVQGSDHGFVEFGDYLDIVLEFAK